MRLGVAWEATNNAYYRAVFPMQAMEKRGHTVIWPARGEEMEAHLRRLASCDVVHMYRRANELARRELAALATGGTSITYDNDDDFTAVPKESPLYKQTGGLHGQRIFAETAKAGRIAYALTTPSPVLADKYRAAGVARVEVIPNAVSSYVERARRAHDGIVIGWIAGVEHRADAKRLGIADALRRLAATNADIRVECIGVDLRLPERYHHDAYVPFPRLPERIAEWDVGLAPLADIPYNRTRSDIKVKEYAASGVPWLASPVGPYSGLGEEQGGRLVPDDRWFEELERMVTDPRTRAQLARRGREWAQAQSIEALADRWEALFAAAGGIELEPATAARAGRGLLARVIRRS